MNNEFTLTNFHNLKELEKRFKKQREESLDKTLFEFDEELKPMEEKIEELVTRYSYVEVLTMAKQHNIRAGTKVEMLTKLIEKGVDGLRENIQNISHEKHPEDSARFKS